MTLEDYRVHAGYSKQFISNLVDLSVEEYNLICSSKTPKLTIRQLYILSVALHVSCDELVHTLLDTAEIQNEVFRFSDEKKMRFLYEEGVKAIKEYYLDRHITTDEYTPLPGDQDILDSPVLTERRLNDSKNMIQASLLFATKEQKEKTKIILNFLQFSVINEIFKKGRIDAASNIELGEFREIELPVLLYHVTNKMSGAMQVVAELASEYQKMDADELPENESEILDEIEEIENPFASEEEKMNEDLEEELEEDIEEEIEADPLLSPEPPGKPAPVVAKLRHESSNSEMPSEEQNRFNTAAADQQTKHASQNEIAAAPQQKEHRSKFKKGKSPAATISLAHFSEDGETTVIHSDDDRGNADYRGIIS